MTEVIARMLPANKATPYLVISERKSDWDALIPAISATISDLNAAMSDFMSNLNPSKKNLAKARSLKRKNAIKIFSEFKKLTNGRYNRTNG